VTETNGGSYCGINAGDTTVTKTNVDITSSFCDTVETMAVNSREHHLHIRRLNTHNADSTLRYSTTWLGGVGHRTCDQQVASLTPGRALPG